MTSENFTTTILRPEEGMFLTNAGDVDIRNRVIATTIALGRNDSAENYVEIDADKADAYRAEQKAALDEDRIKREEEMRNEAE